MSPRAAWRLESLGFTDVFDYVAGKADWFASGLPRAGKHASIPYAGDLARRDVPRCGLTDRVGAVHQQIREASWDVCVVLNDAGVVLGLLREDALNADPETPVEQVMEPGPTTYRPSTPLEAILKYMRKRRRDAILITTSDGKLLGILYRQDAERQLADIQAATSGGS